MKRILNVIAVLTIVGVISTGNVSMAKTGVTRIGTYNKKNVTMRCEFQTLRTVVHGSISYPSNIYLYARPSGKYKSGTKTLSTWASPVSGVGRYASTVACLSGKAFISAKCQYRYGKSKSSYKSNEIKEFWYNE